MSNSLRNQIDLMLKQGSTPEEILAMLAPRAHNDAAREVLEEVANYLKTKQPNRPV